MGTYPVPRGGETAALGKWDLIAIVEAGGRIIS
jgi:hypothetical protein